MCGVRAEVCDVALERVAGDLHDLAREAHAADAWLGLGSGLGLGLGLAAAEMRLRRTARGMCAKLSGSGSSAARAWLGVGLGCWLGLGLGL